jgi:ferredoxin--NADP+ reductase
VPTGARELIPCGIVFRSVGYRGVPIPGVPFDEEHGTLANEVGRVLDERGEPLRGVYSAGWIKRGPTGVIGTNKKDASETVELLLEDARAGLLARPESARSLGELLEARGVSYIAYAGWEAIDAAERGAGELHGRPRVKLCTWDDLLATARRQTVS